MRKTMYHLAPRKPLHYLLTWATRKARAAYLAGESDADYKAYMKQWQIEGSASKSAAESRCTRATADTFFIPKKLGINKDTSEPVFQAPTVIRLFGGSPKAKIQRTTLTGGSTR
jgi:hypothetical protein